MIYEKSLSLPAYRARTVRREFSLFREKEGALAARGLHFRPAGGALVCAEGAEECERVSSSARLFSAEGHGGGLYVYANGVLRAPGGTTYSTAVPKCVLRYLSEGGETLTFVLTANGLYSLRGTAQAVEGAPSGTCGAVHYERLFIADGCTLSWSAPLAPEDWEQREQGAGTVELPDGGGDAFALIPLGEALYLFRRRGITRLSGFGDIHSLRAEAVKVSCGEIEEDSARRCGDKILFLAEGGAYAFDGERCKRLTGCGASETSAPASFASYGGRYFAAVEARDERCLWCLDPAEGTGHFIRFRAQSVAAGEDGLYFTEEGTLYRLTERGLPELGRKECVLETEPSLLGLSARNKFLDGITVEGRGGFCVEARGERGPIRTVCGRAGERLRFPAPVKGVGFALRLRTIEKDARVGAVTLDLREETAW